MLESAEVPLDVPEAFREQLGRLWEAYQGAQRALASDDPERARVGAGSAEEVLKSVDHVESEGSGP